MAKIVADHEVVEVRYPVNDSFIISFRSPVDIPQILPGNFAEIQIENTTGVFLRRPFSILDVDYDSRIISFFIKIIGKGTKRLGEAQRGDKVSLMYPLGNSFTMPVPEKKVLIVGGGSGIAPFVMLGRNLKKNGNKVTFLIGGKSKKDVLISALFSEFGEVFTTTEDGSAGERGFVTDHSLIKTGSPPFDKIYSCGPEAMMKAVGKIAKQNNIDCEVSLENMMACGFGACLCCVTETIDGNKRVCKEGPVFNINYLKWRI